MMLEGIRKITASPVSMVDMLPTRWTVEPSEDGAFLLLGSDSDNADPRVLVRVEQAIGAGRDLGAWCTQLLRDLVIGLLTEPEDLDLSMVDLLPTLWTIAAGDDGGWLLLGGVLAGDPDVLVRVEHAHGGNRNLTESFCWLLGELLARVVHGTTQGTDLSDDEITELNSQLRLLLSRGR